MTSDAPGIKSWGKPRVTKLLVPDWVAPPLLVATKAYSYREPAVSELRLLEKVPTAPAPLTSTPVVAEATRLLKA